MKCQVCNSEASPGAQFCQRCGTKLDLAGAAAGKKPSEPGIGAAPELAAANLGPTVTSRRRQDVPEEILWEGSYSPKAMLGTAMISGAISLLCIGGMILQIVRKNPFWFWGLILLLFIWIAFFPRLAARRLGIHYQLTNQMFYHRRGILTRTTNRVEVIDIDDITYTQGLLERLVHVGRIEILSSDRTNPKFEIEGVDNVEEVAKKMDRARCAERIRRGVSVESLTPGASGG